MVFISKRNKLIQFIEIKTNDTIHNYEFNTDIAKKEYRKNKSRYFVEKLQINPKVFYIFKRRYKKLIKKSLKGLLVPV